MQYACVGKSGKAGRVALPAVLAAVLATALHAQVTTVQFASGVTTPQGGAVLTGTGISPVTGKFFRHLWSADPVNGLCRLDPDIDSAGPHTINAATCLTAVGAIALNAGELSFDPTTNDTYAVDQAGKNGIFRLHYLPAGDSGHGLMDTVNHEILGPNCNIAGNQPTAAALGPDGNLYVGFKRVGSIMRIISPQTEPLPCANVQSQVILVNTADQGLGWTGHNLFATDKRITDIFINADACFTPIQGNTVCNPANFLTVPPGIMTSDQAYPSLNGTNVFISQTTSVTRFSTVTNTVTLNYGGGLFSTISGLAVDSTNAASPVLYVGDDPSNGLTPGSGRWFQISAAPPPPAPPGTPTNVTASAGDTVATVSWAPATDGQPLTSFTVHDSFASNGLPVADVLVTPPSGTTIVPTSVTVGGLTDGVSYQFEVKATNGVGSSALSAPSNTVTPFAVTPPGAPTNVTALAGNALASVAWTAPPSNGAPITSYTVTALVGGVPSGITALAGGTATGINVTGLTNGTTYTFTVHATNSAGSGPESAPTAPVTPLAPPPNQAPDMSITMSGPASGTFGANATYTLSVVNNDPFLTAAQVNVFETVPLGATFVSAGPSQGTCGFSAGSVNCQLGSMAAAATATINVVLNLTGTVTTQATVVALDSTGTPFTDPTPTNNTASVTTSVAVPPTTTDVQTTGSAQNGGPTHGNLDTFTWQIKDNTSISANGVVFTTTLPSSFQFSSAGANAGGACTTPAAGSLGGVITCRTATLPGGQTMTVTINFVPTTIGTIPTTGSATFTGTDTNTANNSFTVTIQVK